MKQMVVLEGQMMKEEEDLKMEETEKIPEAEDIKLTFVLIYKNNN